MSFAGRILIPAPHGQLEALYRPTSQQAERVALVLHPHPLYGGTMHNKVVYQTAKALEGAGFETLRFNFRGVEGSSGGHDHGHAEVEDARVALDYLVAQQPSAREVLVAGFSFGAAVALRFGCGDARVQRIVAIGTPADWFDADFFTRCGTAITFIHGEHDQVAPLRKLVRLVSPERVRVIAGADHFFADHLDELRVAVTAAVA